MISETLPKTSGFLANACTKKCQTLKWCLYGGQVILQESAHSTVFTRPLQDALMHESDVLETSEKESGFLANTFTNRREKRVNRG